MITIQSVIKEKIIKLPRGLKEFIVIINDIIIATFSFTFTFLLSSNDFSKIYNQEVTHFFIISTLILLFVFKIFNIYSTVTRYLGLYDFHVITKSICVFALTCSSYLFLSETKILSVTFPIIQSFFLFCLIIFSRHLASNFLIVKNKQKKLRKRSLIYGAGDAGIHLYNLLEKGNQFHVVGFIDDNESLQNRLINNLKILNPNNITSFQTYYGITEVILAMPTIDKKRKLEIIELLSSYKLNVYSLPDISQYRASKVSLIDLKRIDIPDIISRSIHKPIETMFTKNIYKKTVMFTGGVGSIGFELLKQSLLLNATSLLLIDMNELELYNAEEN